MAPLQWKGGAADSRASPREAEVQVEGIRLTNTLTFLVMLGTSRERASCKLLGNIRCRTGGLVVKLQKRKYCVCVCVCL